MVLLSPQGGPEAAAGSGTMDRRGRRHRAVSALRGQISLADLRQVKAWAGARRPGLSKAEAGR